MSGLTADRCDAASAFAYQTAPHPGHIGRDHGYFVSKPDDHGCRVSKEWSPGVERCSAARMLACRLSDNHEVLL
jgi:hypothetical protein